MTMFRPHRGSLADAMAEVVEVADRRALFTHLLSRPYGPEILSGSTAETLVIQPFGSGGDDRIGWSQTYVVKTGATGVLGFTDGPL